MRRLSIAAVIATGLAVLPGMIAAQDLTQLLPPPVLQSVMARDTWLGPDQWTDPAPATYMIQVAGSDQCLAWANGDTRSQVPYLKLRQCDGFDANQNLELSPALAAVPLFPATSNVRWRINNRGECAGIARNVLIGAPRVDFNPCGMTIGAGGNPAFRGAEDQQLVMVRTALGRYRFRTTDGRCWSVGGAVQEGAQLQIEPCDGRAGQVFQLTVLGGVAEPTNQDAADRFGWVQIGTVTGSNASDRFRRLGGIDLPGSDIANFTTAADSGRACAIACAGNRQCRSFTWVRPGVQNDAAMCWLKNSVPYVTLNGQTVSGIVRP